MGSVSLDRNSLKSLYPFRSRYLHFDDLRYHYLDEGRGEPVVMLHGNPTWSFYYRELVRGLSDKYRAIVPDHIGCGLSDKPPIGRYPYRLQNRVDDLDRLLSHLDIAERLTLVLHDWGGIIGICYALRHPDRLARLVVLNTAAFIPPAGKWLPWRLRLIRNGKLLSALLVQGLNAFALAAVYMASYKGLSGPVRQGLLAPYDCWSHRIATLKFVEDIPLASGDPSYDLVNYADKHLHLFSEMPTLICWGLRDFVFDRDYLAEWQQRFKTAETHAFEDAGHYVLEDVPERIIPLVRRFLEQHPLAENDHSPDGKIDNDHP